MVIKLYKMDGSPPVRAVQMLADLLKLEYIPVDVNLPTGENLKPEYLEKNPNHTIPTLEDDGFFIGDSHAILTYLVEKYGEKQAQLYPKDLKLRTTVNQRLFFEAASIRFARGAAYGAIMRKNATGPTKEQIEEVNGVYNTLETYLSKTKFVACDHLTVADISCLSSVSTLDVVVPINVKYVKLTAWINTLKKEEWHNNQGLALFAGYIKAAIAKNSAMA